MASFGNTGASSLISAANAAASKNQSLNDSLASYQYDLSAKDDTAFGAYESYLNSQAQKYASDPSKTLTYEKALTSAHKSYTSATISRVGTQINYGGADLSTKYDTLSQLRDAAMQNGDDALAQSLESQMASTSVAIQNKQLSDASKASAASSKAQTANKAGVDKVDHNIAQQENLYKLALQHGQMTTVDYEKNVAKLYQTRNQLYTDAADGKYGDLGSSQTDYLTKSDALQASPAYVAAISAGQGATNGQPTTYNKTDPTKRDADGNMLSTPTALPGAKVIQNADGTYSTTHDFGFEAGESGSSGGDTAANRLKAAQAGGTYIMDNIVALKPGQAKGTGGSTGPNGGQLIADPKNPGQFFVIDQNGNKHYVSTDPKSLLQRSQAPLTPQDAKAGHKVGFGDILANTTEADALRSGWRALTKGGTNLFDRAGAILHPGMPGGGLQSNMLGTASIHQQQLAASKAALAKAQAAIAAVNARIAAQSPVSKPLAPTAAARTTTLAAANNVTPGAAKVLATAPINTPTISQAQAKAANFVAQNGGYKTNIQAPKPSILQQARNFIGF